MRSYLVDLMYRKVCIQALKEIRMKKKEKYQILKKEIAIMTSEEFKNLSCGDIVRHKSNGEVLVITNNYGDHVIAVKTYDMRNPDEWKLILKANHKPTGETKSCT
jgi:hypothetical protein